jgi:hypothetical protein
MTENDYFMTMNEDQLLATIGERLEKLELRAVPPRLEVLKQRAEKWLRANRDKLRKLLCHNQKVRHLAKNGFSADLVVAVLALIESLSLGTAASPLAVLLCRRGITSLCEDIWSDEPNGTSKGTLSG